MLGQSFENAGVFLVQVLFNIYIFVLIARFLLHINRADFYGPVSQFFIKFSNPVVKPFQKFIPTVASIDLAVLTVIFILEIIKATLLIYLQLGVMPNFWGIFIWAIGEITNFILNVYFLSIIVQVIFSWVKPKTFNPFFETVYRLNFPILHPIQQIIPPIAGVDISPIPALILVRLCNILISHPLMSYGFGIAT